MGGVDIEHVDVSVGGDIDKPNDVAVNLGYLGIGLFPGLVPLERVTIVVCPGVDLFG